MKEYNPQPLQRLLRQLLNKSGESYRRASLDAGLHQASVTNYMHGTRPSRDACIALADHFDVNPNEMLQAAGYKPLRFFESSADDKAYPPAVRDVADALTQFGWEPYRQEMCRALLAVLQATTEWASQYRELLSDALLVSDEEFDQALARLNALAGFSQNWQVAKAQVARFDVFGEPIRRGDRFYQRRYASHSGTVDLSNNSMKRFLHALFHGSRELEELADRLLEIHREKFRQAAESLVTSTDNSE